MESYNTIAIWNSVPISQANPSRVGYGYFFIVDLAGVAFVKPFHTSVMILKLAMQGF